MSVLSYQLIKIHSLNAMFLNKAKTTIDWKVTHAWIGLKYSAFLLSWEKHSWDKCGYSMFAEPPCQLNINKVFLRAKKNNHSHFLVRPNLTCEQAHFCEFGKHFGGTLPRWCRIRTSGPTRRLVSLYGMLICSIIEVDQFGFCHGQFRSSQRQLAFLAFIPFTFEWNCVSCKCVDNENGQNACDTFLIVSNHNSPYIVYPRSR